MTPPTSSGPPHDPRVQRIIERQETLFEMIMCLGLAVYKVAEMVAPSPSVDEEHEGGAQVLAALEKRRGFDEDMNDLIKLADKYSE